MFTEQIRPFLGIKYSNTPPVSSPVSLYSKGLTGKLAGLITCISNQSHLFQSKSILIQFSINIKLPGQDWTCLVSFDDVRTAGTQVHQVTARELQQHPASSSPSPTPTNYNYNFALSEHSIQQLLGLHRSAVAQPFRITFRINVRYCQVYTEMVYFESESISV